MIYKDSSKSIEKRVTDLLLRMSLKQKIAQLQCIFSVYIGHAEFRDIVSDGVGEVAFGYQMDSPEKNADYIESLQRYLMEGTELGIPAIIHMEALSGGVMSEMTLFPSPIGLAAAWDPEGIRKMAELIRKQVMAVGVRKVLSPLADIARDPRWGRIGETFGEDPVLCSAMVTACIKGLQGKDLNEGVSACAKHFLGYGLSEGGLNQTHNPVTTRELREVYAKPFQAAITESDLTTLMAQYGSIDGEMVTASESLLYKLLRKEMKFKGVVVSDYMAINRMVAMKVAGGLGEAGIAALKAGLDVEYPTPAGFKTDILIKAVDKGIVEEKMIDRSVKRVLRQKFKLGLFENPYPRRENFKKYFYNTENDMMSFELAQKSIVLIKNDGVLPLSKKIKKIAVIGPHADSIRLLFGNYSYPAMVETVLDPNVNVENAEGSESSSVSAGKVAEKYPGSNTIVQNPMIEDILRSMLEKSKTILQAIQKNCKNAEVLYAKGCDIAGNDIRGFDLAVKIAESADVVILALGGKHGWGQMATIGESLDSMSIGLPGVQEALVKKVYSAGKPTVVLHLDGRPLSSEFIAEKCHAVLECWSPSILGGQAIASVLFGDFNPSGKLPVTVARNAGQIPIYYNHVNGSSYHNHNIFKHEPMYVDGPETPLFYFGHGLSYTRFEYSNLKLNERLEGDGELTVSVDICNVGQRDGTEVVQLYISDELCSLLRPNKELAGFKRVLLKVKEKKTVTFMIRASQMAFLDSRMKWKVESGEMTVMVGASSEDIRLKGTFYIANDVYVNGAKRGFFADTKEKSAL